MKLVIAGAGVIGLFTALEAARRGAQVTLVDAASPGGGATAGSFGWINASFAETDAYYALRKQAVAAWAGLGLGAAAGLRLTGALWWEDEGAEFDQQARDLTRRGWDARLVGGAEIAAIEPALATPPGRAIFTPGEGAVDSAPLISWLLGQLAGMGAQVVLGPRVTGLLHENGSVVGLATSRGDIRADRVVLALGGGTSGFFDDGAVRVDEKPGLILHTTPIAPCLNGVLMTPGIHMRQATDGHLVVGEVFSGDGPDPDRVRRDPLGLAAEMMARLATRLPAAGDARIARVFTPRRPVPPDGLPMVGPLEGGAYVATMHSGITLAPLIGALVADEVLTGQESPALQPFRPNRFA